MDSVDYSWLVICTTFGIFMSLIFVGIGYVLGRTHTDLIKDEKKEEENG